MSSHSTFFRLAICLSSASLFTGCESLKVSLISCIYEFQADVNEGTNAGLALSGQLGLDEIEEGALDATFTDVAEGDIAVGAEYAEGEIVFTFSTGEGDVVGTGEFDIDSCLDTIEGGLVGPAEDDAGHWEGSLD